MLPHVADARYLGGFAIRIRFSDGAEGDIDLEDELHGPVFELLRNPEFFRQFRIHPELRTLVWPNGADFAPEFLRSAMGVAV